MDNDPYAHVNNVVYYSYFDTAVNELLIKSGVLDIRHSTVIGFVVETQCRFYKPMAFPDSIDAGVRVARIGTSSVRYEIGIFRNDDETPAAQGRFVPMSMLIVPATVRSLPCLKPYARCCSRSCSAVAKENQRKAFF